MNKEQETMKLLSFNQVLQMTELSKRHILLGNGFSRAFDSERFSYTSLKESAIQQGIITKEDKVYHVFDELKTSDFETVMKTLDDSEKILKIYDPQSQISMGIKNDSKKIKSYLAQVITNNHPDNSFSIGEEQKQSCINFLHKFKKIYTLNYDLLVYWSYVDKEDKLCDGFANDDESEDKAYVIYKNDRTPLDIFYLHGALHYYDKYNQIIKITYNNSSIKLVEQIQSKLNDNIYPIFISEGDSAQKMYKIIHNAYLNHCYKSLCNISGDLIIFGASLSAHDDHILKAVLQNKVTNVFYATSSLDNNNTQRLNAEFDLFNQNASKKKNLYFFDYRTVNPWKDSIDDKN